MELFPSGVDVLNLQVAMSWCDSFKGSTEYCTENKTYTCTCITCTYIKLSEHKCMFVNTFRN